MCATSSPEISSLRSAPNSGLVFVFLIKFAQSGCSLLSHPARQTIYKPIRQPMTCFSVCEDPGDIYPPHAVTCIIQLCFCNLPWVIWRRVAGTTHMVRWLSISIFVLAKVFESFCSCVLPFPFFMDLWRTIEFLCLWVLLGWICGWTYSLDHCLHPIGVVLDRDPSWSPFEFVWENPNKAPSLSGNLICILSFGLF